LKGLSRQAELLRTGIRTLGGALIGAATVGGLGVLIDRTRRQRLSARPPTRSGSTKHLYRSGSSSTADHILWLSSGTTPNLRHQASGGGTVSITSSVALVNDTT
jgi:hypothetical protein